jgi:class 3 adenylate cyclase/predicted ATPase
MLMRCSNCSAENPQSAKFCSECASPIVAKCQSCGANNKPGAKFCNQCAAPLDASTRAAPIESRREIKDDIAGERRHLSVLFCDLVGSTEIASRVDPEEWREIVGNYHRAGAQAIERFGGHVAQYLGDGVMAYFGWPEAHDNDAERAARAGLALLDALSKLNQHPTHPKLAARVGIDSGAVVVGAGAGKEVDVFGDTPNVAARVQAAAEPGTVLITEALYRLVHGLFLVEDRGTAILKGIELPLQLYRVVQPSVVRGRLEAVAAARGLTPFVGRDDELRSLINRWERTLDGEGQVALIIGEAGIGKSRLVHRFREQIAGTPHTWIEGTAAPFFQGTPFYPIVDVLHQLVWEQSFRSLDEYLRELQAPGASNDGSKAESGESFSDDQFAGLQSGLVLAGLEPAQAIPLIAPLLNLPLSTKYRPSQLSPEHQRRRLLATLVEWLLGATRVQPVVIAIEDLHWADPSTLELLQLLAEQGATARLLLLCTARPEFHVPWPLRAHHAQITLNRLSASDIRAMVLEVAARKALSDETVATVVERTGGVPLFAEELTRVVLESAEAKLSVSEIPVTLHDSLMARLDRLGAAKEVAQVGAVIGGEFSYDLLHAVHPIAEEDLQSALRKLADAEMLYVRGIAPDAKYQFKHALIRDAAYEALLKTRRRELHRHVANVVSQQFPDIAQARPEILAHHYTEAGLAAEAVPLWLRAGETMSQRTAHLEAIGHLTKGLGLLATLPDTLGRAQQELALQTTLGTSLLATRGFGASETGQAYIRARELCRRLGETRQLFPVLAGLRFFYVAQGNLQTAQELGEQFLQLAQSTGDPALILEGHYAVAVPLHLLGEFVAAREHCDLAIALYDSAQHRSQAFLYGLDSGVASRSLAAWLLWELGYPERAVVKSLEAISLAGEVSHPISLANALASAGLTQMWCGQRQLALESTEALIALAKEKRFSSFLAIGTLLHGWVLTAQGQEDEGIAQILKGISDWRATGARGNGTGHLAILLEAYLKRGQTEEAMPVLSEALSMVEEIGERNNEARLYQLKGELLRARGADGDLEAERNFRAAIRIARNQHAKSLELRASTSLARLLHAHGRRDEARALLAEIYRWFTEGFDTADLKDAKSLLEELSA